MKSLRKFFALLFISAAAFITPHKAAAQVTVSFQLFYDQLSPYGTWVNYPGPGYVWIPNAETGFSPYSTGGHWVFTEYGWTWVSDYAWGWAPFHYGRWNYESPYGWMWVPGNEWGPAWVTWRKSPGYYGWVPMGYGRDKEKDNDRWIFVKDRDIDRSDISRHYINHSNNVTIIKNSTEINNYRTDKSHNVTYNGGPGRDEVQKAKGKPVKAVALQDNDKPGQQMSNGQLKIYRPEVQKDNSNQSHPAKVTDINDAKLQQGQNEGKQKQQPKQQPSKDQQHKDKEKPANKDKHDNSPNIPPNNYKENH